jgi:hypothetical protein
MDSTVEQVIYLLLTADYLHYHSRIYTVTSISNLDWIVEEENYSLSEETNMASTICMIKNNNAIIVIIHILERVADLL